MARRRAAPYSCSAVRRSASAARPIAAWNSRSSLCSVANPHKDLSLHHEKFFRGTRLPRLGFYLTIPHTECAATDSTRPKLLFPTCKDASLTQRAQMRANGEVLVAPHAHVWRLA